jgi:hypothetical protein
MFKKHLWAWAIFTLFFIIGSSLYDESLVSKHIIEEQAMVQSFMRDSASNRIQSRTNDTYSICCNWLADISRTYFVPPSRDEDGMFDTMARGHQEFWTSVYLIIYRLFVLIEWLLVFGVVFIACVVQGLVKRDVDVTNTAWSSPIRYHSGLHFALAVIGIQVNLFFYPWVLHPIVPVATLTVFSFVLFIITSNIQHKV